MVSAAVVNASMPECAEPAHSVPAAAGAQPRAAARNARLGPSANGHFYFVNSYCCAPDDPADVLGVTDYGGEFCSVVARGNVVATQFHAEKSGELGLELLRGFAAWDPQAASC